MPFVISSPYPPTPLTTGDEAVLTIRLTALSAVSSANQQEYIPRLTVDGEEVMIRACGWQKSVNGIGVDCAFTLADIADRSLITAESSLKFEVATVVSGVPEWHTKADLQKLSDRQFSVSGDTFSFRSVSGVVDKLNTSPVVPFLMYDPDKVPFDADKVESLFDTEGREYPVEAIPVEGLTLDDILQEVADRCGFDSHWTDCENYKVPQLAVDITETFWGALHPLIEPYSAPNTSGPLVTEKDGVLNIYDTSKGIPTGFPEPMDLTIFGCSELSIDAGYSDVVAVKMQYSTTDSWDYSTSRLFVSDLPIGNDDFTGDILHRLLVTNTHELRSHAAPDVVIDERLQIYWEYVRAGIVDISQEITENFYDKYARLVATHLQKWSRLPDGTGTTVFIGTEPDEDEWQYTGYEQHPFKIGQQYQSSISRQSTGRISVNAANPYLGAPFRQPLRTAHWVGNADVGITVEDGTLRTFQESYTMQRNGQISRRIRDYDNVRGIPLTQRYEPNVGDLSLNGDNAGTRDLLVTQDDEEYTGGRVVSIAVGTLPISIAKPLVKRKLKQMQTKTQSTAVNIIGVNHDIDAGTTFAVSNKDYGVEGNFICEGYSGSGEINGDGSFSWSMSVQGIEI